ncbi:MAG: hypothetical protein FWG88_05520 [Oscillospiraceae bacterium]|nr:hypothetical protein [Oscillospiraceae bacterium]
MSGEISYFRKRFFGGFNRDDVIDYIEKMAKERNELEETIALSEDEKLTLKEENEKLRKEIEGEKEKAKIITQTLSDDIGKLRTEIDAAKALAESVKKNHANEIANLRQESDEAKRLMRESVNREAAIFDAAWKTLSDCESAISELNSDIDKKVLAAISELSDAKVSLDKLPLTILQVSERINEMKAAFNKDNTNMSITMDE